MIFDWKNFGDSLIQIDAASEDFKMCKPKIDVYIDEKEAIGNYSYNRLFLDERANECQ